MGQTGQNDEIKGIAHKRNTVLIVEDENVFLEVCRDLLQDTYRLQVAKNGDETWDILGTDPPDIILMDLMLPDTNGIRLCQKIKNITSLQGIPLIIVTASDDPIDKIKALDAGAGDFLQKPIDEVELKLKIKNHLQIKNLSEQLNRSYESIITINNISDTIMSRFDPHYFDLKRDILHMLRGYTSQIKKSDELPGYIMIAFPGIKKSIDSVLYKIVNRKPVKVGDPIQAKDLRLYSDGFETEDVHFANLEEANKAMPQVQAGFHPQLREAIGQIVNFIGYHGKEVYIIGFNYPKPVNRFMAQALKSFALNGNFFKVIQDQLSEVRDAYTYALNSLARAAEAQDQVTGEHIARVNHYSQLIADKLKLPEKLAYDIGTMAQMHDIGKIHIHPDILQKAGKPTPGEWEEIKKHPAYGAKILGNSRYMKVARNICLGHHENFDGSGYPLGKKGEEIPIEARVVRLADVYDSLRSVRPYKPAFSHEKAVVTILEGDEIVMPRFFDPTILAIFKEHLLEFAAIYDALTDEEAGAGTLPDEFS